MTSTDTNLTDCEYHAGGRAARAYIRANADALAEKAAGSGIIVGKQGTFARADDVARLATAREQWRNFLAIQRAATSAGEGAAAGVLSPSALRSAVVQQGRASYAQGQRGELGNLARAAEGVIKPLPTSGTAENMRALGVPSAIWSAAGAAGGFHLGGGPVGGLLGAMAAGAAPAAAGAARMSGPIQNWLANQAVGRGSSILPANALAPVPSALTEVNRQ